MTMKPLKFKHAFPNPFVYAYTPIDVSLFINAKMIRLESKELAMAKAAKKKVTKPRAEEYEKKVSFEGTFEDMIAISVKDAEKKVKAKKNKKE